MWKDQGDFYFLLHDNFKLISYSRILYLGILLKSMQTMYYAYV